MVCIGFLEDVKSITLKLVIMIILKQLKNVIVLM